MLVVSQFARAVMPHGTTTMFTDPHEVANVLGLVGVRLMHDEAMVQPINVFVEMPSCAPSAPGLETPGRRDRARRRGRGDGLAGDRRARRDDELPRRHRRRPEDARRDRRHPGRRQGGGRPLREPRPHRLPGLCRRRTRRRPRRNPRGGRDRARPPGHAGDAAPRLGLVRREGADHRRHREGPRPAQLHPLHRRLPFRHAGERRPHGPRRPPRHRLRPRPARRAADGDDQHRDAFRAWSASSARSRRGGGPTASSPPTCAPCRSRR